MNVTISSPAELITCARRGTHVHLTESYYVDEAGQLCTANCTSPPTHSSTSSPPARTTFQFATALTL